jgi:hypothetical protein
MFFAPLKGKQEDQSMSIVTKSSLNQTEAKTLFAPRRYIAAGMLGGALLFGGASRVEAAALPQHPCTPELQKLLSDWNTQATVYSRSGHLSSGPEVRYMASEIQQAISDCQNGDVPSVRAHVANVNEKLNPQS